MEGYTKCSETKVAIFYNCKNKNTSECRSLVKITKENKKTTCTAHSRKCLSKLNKMKKNSMTKPQPILHENEQKFTPNDITSFKYEGDLNKYIKIPGDGNCFYNSLKIGIGSTDKNMVKKMRQRAAEELVDNGNYKSLYIGIIDYAELIRVDKFWASSMEMVLMSRVMNINIIVYDIQNKNFNSLCYLPTLPYILLRFSGNHFDYLGTNLTEEEMITLRFDLEETDIKYNENPDILRADFCKCCLKRLNKNIELRLSHYSKCVMGDLE